MLRLFRVRAWCLATALFLAMGTAGTSLELLLHADTAHHVDPCADAILAHQESAHRIAAPDDDAGQGGPAHCVACHLARAFRLRSEGASLAARPDTGRAVRVPPSIGIALSPALSNLPPRSPPHAA